MAWRGVACSFMYRMSHKISVLVVVVVVVVIVVVVVGEKARP